MKKPTKPKYQTDKLYVALVAALRVTIAENGGEKGSREYWRVQSLITDLRPEHSKADPNSPLEETADGITNGYAAELAG